MKNKNWTMLLILAALWGPSFLFIKIAVHDFPPLTLVAARLVIGAGLLYGILRLRGQTLPRGWRAWRKFVFIGFFANALPFSLFSIGEQFTDSGPAAILNGTTPIFTVIFTHFLISDEKLTPGKIGGVLISFGGILLLFLPEFQTLLRGESLKGPLATWGLLAFLAASICYGVSLTFGRLHLRGLPPLVGPTAQLICASVMMLPVALVVERPFNLSPGAPAVYSMLALAVFGTALAYLVYYRLVDTASATFISLVTYILPPVGIVLGAVFLHEQPGWYALAGCGLIIFGVMIVNGVFTNFWRYLTQPEAVT